MEIERRRTPEEEELHRKHLKLTTLEGQLAERELELATLRAELGAFERRYLSRVGARYAELDELLAQIAEAEARRKPKHEAAQRQAAASREQADETARTAEAACESKQENHFHPSDTLKKLFREAAKAVHPDLAEDEEDRVRRNRFMAEANRAYEDGDENALAGHRWRSGRQARRRSKARASGRTWCERSGRSRGFTSACRRLRIEIQEARESELCKLKAKVEDADEDWAAIAWREWPLGWTLRHCRCPPAIRRSGTKSDPDDGFTGYRQTPYRPSARRELRTSMPRGGPATTWHGTTARLAADVYAGLRRRREDGIDPYPRG